MTRAAAFAAGTVPALPVAADSLRCDGGVVSVGDTTATVLAACGEPHHRTGYQRQYRPADAPGTLRVIDVETWTYRRGYGRFILHLQLEGGRVIRIDRGPRQK